MSNEIFFSTDMESDGPHPLKNSMISLGSVLLDVNGNPLGEEFSVNIQPLEGRIQDMETMNAFWMKHPAALAEAMRNPQDAAIAMQSFADWVKAMADKYDASPIFAAYPAEFDFTFVILYLMQFVPGSVPFGRPNGTPFYGMLDMQSKASGILRKPYKQCAKKNWPKEWRSGKELPHIALEDARIQGEELGHMLRLCNGPLVGTA